MPPVKNDDSFCGRWGQPLRRRFTFPRKANLAVRRAYRGDSCLAAYCRAGCMPRVDASAFGTGAALTPLSHSSTGAAIYTELYVPTIMPTRNANAKLCNPSPPKKYRITITMNTVNTVRIVRLSV